MHIHDTCNAVYIRGLTKNKTGAAGGERSFMRKKTLFISIGVIGAFLYIIGSVASSWAELSALEIKRIEKAIGKVKSEARGTKGEGYREIQAIGANAGPYLAEALDDKSLTTESRKLICELLGELRVKEGVAPLIYNLKNKTETIRAAACKSLGMIKDPQAIDPLIGMLSDENSWAREEAIYALMEFDIKTPPAIADLLRDQKDTVRLAAIKFLNKKLDPSTAKAIGEALAKDKSDNVRAIAAKTLGELKDKAAVDILMEVVTEDTYSAARQEAAVALGKIGDQKAISSLIKALKDDYKDIQLSAAQSLKNITGQDFGRDYEKWVAWFEEQSR